MKLSLCNEVLLPMDLAAQCAFAAALGYDGLEIAPFTLAEDPTRLTSAQVAALRRMIEDHGLAVTSLHWLAMAPGGLSITATDPGLQARTADALARIVDLAAGLGAAALVHGSPAQRQLDGDRAAQREVALAHFAALGRRAAAAGMAYCIEALNRRECTWINRLDEVEAIIAATGEPGLKLMIDLSHAAQEEAEPVADLAARHLAAGRLAHVQVNAINRRGPGEGDDPAGRDDPAPLIAALRTGGYTGAVAVEPFVYHPDGPACAARAAGFMRALMPRFRTGRKPAPGAYN